MDRHPPHAGHDHHGHADGQAHGHAHGHAHGAGDERAVGLAALLTGGFLVVEVAGGLASGSLALLADAGHMLTDLGALVLAWLAARLARRPASGRRTYGFDRASVLAAFVNGLALFAIAAWIAVEALGRLRSPAPVEGGLLLGVAALGLLVNLVAWRVLSHGDHHGLNRRAAALHVAGDLLGSVAAIAAGVVILATGWTPIDPILSLLATLIILRSAWSVTRQSAHILLEAAPEGLDPGTLAGDLVAAVPGLAAVRHVHAWSISEARPMVTLEAEPAPGADPAALRRAVKARLSDRHGVGHATVEMVDPEG